MSRTRPTRGPASAQAALVRLEGVEDCVAHLAGGRSVAVLEVSGVDFGLRGEQQQEVLVAGFAAFLNGLTFPVQILVRVQPTDLRRYFEDLRRVALREPNRALSALARDHVDFVHRLARDKTLLERRFYVVVPADARGAGPVGGLWPFGRRRERGDAALADRRRLAVRCDQVRAGLERCGLAVHRLGDAELAQLWHACWSPELARTQRLKRHLSEYTHLVVRTDRPVADAGPAGAARERTVDPAPTSGPAEPDTGDGRGVRLPFLPVGRRGAPAPLGPDERRFALGARTLADLVAPAAFVVRDDHVRLERQYVRGILVTNFPRTVEPGWLTRLIDFQEPLELAIHVEPLDSGQIIRQLGYKLVQFQSSRLVDARSGRLGDPEREVAFEDAETLRDRLQRGEERVFSVALYLLLRAPSLQTLDELTRRVEVELDGMMAQSRGALFEQDLAFRACLPEGRGTLPIYRNLDTSSLATTFPFASTTLSMEQGVLYGIATTNNSPVIFDPFDASLLNANEVVFAKSGAGKSYATKVKALRFLQRGVDFLVIDPEDEYRAVCEAVDGQYLRLASSSPHKLNPFDLPPPDPTADEGRDPLAEQVAAVLGLLEVMLAAPGRPLGPRERAVLDRAVYLAYAARGIVADPATHDRPPPLMRDLLGELDALAEDDRDAEDLADRLRRYVEGSLAGLFGGPTNVALDRRFVVFNVQALEEELRPIGIHLIANFVWTLVRREKKPRLLVVDEAWTLMQYEAGGQFLESMARRARKYYLGLVTLTQDVADFLESEHGRKVLTNAAIKLLMKQDASTIGPVVRAFGLAEDERGLLLGAAKGQGLLFARDSRVAIEIKASPAEHTLATTAPKEIADRERAARERARAERAATEPAVAPGASPEPGRDTRPVAVGDPPRRPARRERRANGRPERAEVPAVEGGPRPPDDELERDWASLDARADLDPESERGRPPPTREGAPDDEPALRPGAEARRRAADVPSVRRPSDSRELAERLVAEEEAGKAARGEQRRAVRAEDVVRGRSFAAEDAAALRRADEDADRRARKEDTGRRDGPGLRLDGDRRADVEVGWAVGGRGGRADDDVHAASRSLGDRARSSDGRSGSTSAGDDVAGDGDDWRALLAEDERRRHEEDAEEEERRRREEDDEELDRRLRSEREVGR
ncbi:MAG: ATP-binding protein [Chloroflexi bacterium]|nr:ATP-binding protein [Chloroflexota bacterium]